MEMLLPNRKFLVIGSAVVLGLQNKGVARPTCAPSRLLQAQKKFWVANPISGVERSDKSSGVIRINAHVLRGQIAGKKFQRGASGAQRNADFIDRL